MSGKKIFGIMLALLGLIGAYYYIGGYFQVKSQFGNVFGAADETLKNYWPMMAASIAVLILGIFLILKGDEKPSISNNTNSTPIQTSSTASLNFDGDKSLANDSYKIFLVKKYGIEKNDALGKIICQGKLFDDIEQALKHAAQIDGAISGLSAPSNVAHLTEIQKALSNEEKIIKEGLTANQWEEAKVSSIKSGVTISQWKDMTNKLISSFGIIYLNRKYCFDGFQFEYLSEAIDCAKNNSSATKSKDPSSADNSEAVAYGISFDGEKYCYKDYKYDKLQDAINYAKKNA
jgi:hypothetical protein